MKEELLAEIIGLIAPGEISKNFEVMSVKEKKDSITIVFEERGNLIPQDLKGKDAVLDGFLNPVELQTFPLKDKTVYLSLTWTSQNQTGIFHTHLWAYKKSCSFVLWN
ncbi:MAG: hypothetical protein K8S16_17280 [Bacteroidales bacterium]|nr:hypothetical protein [Bacteroidales bacterium]